MFIKTIGKNHLSRSITVISDQCLYCRNVKFWLICLTFGVSQGVFSSWQGVLDVNLKPHNISQVVMYYNGPRPQLSTLDFRCPTNIVPCVDSVLLAKFSYTPSKFISSCFMPLIASKG